MALGDDDVDPYANQFGRQGRRRTGSGTGLRGNLGQRFRGETEAGPIRESETVQNDLLVVTIADARLCRL